MRSRTGRFSPTVTCEPQKGTLEGKWGSCWMELRDLRDLERGIVGKGRKERKKDPEVIVVCDEPPFFYRTNWRLEKCSMRRGVEGRGV